jgi:Protein of unknown function (DUF3024)
VAGGLPELDVARVQRWCAGQVPEQVRDEVRVECDVAPRHLTICECRPPWREDFGPDWTRFPIARLHYTKTTRLWTLYWRDRNLTTAIAHLRDVLGDQAYESLARKGETMTTAAMATYAYDQIDQARTELNAVSK